MSIKNIYLHCAKITKVILSTLVYRLFYEVFSTCRIVWFSRVERNLDERVCKQILIKLTSVIFVHKALIIIIIYLKS